MRLRNLTVAIFDYAGYRKPLKNVPMLLVGGLRAWCNLVRESPLRKVTWNAESVTSGDVSTRVPKDEPMSRTRMTSVERKVRELDLEDESEWLESLHYDKFASTYHIVLTVQESTSPDARWCRSKEAQSLCSYFNLSIS